MKKKLIIIVTILSGTALFMSSCLKDKSHYVDFSQGGTFVDFGSGGFVNFASEAITESAPDSVNGQPNTNEAITRQFAVNVASVNLPTTPTTVTLAVGDQSYVDKLNSLQSNVVYELMPTTGYSLTATKVTVPAGQQYAVTSVTFFKALLDPSKSYVLPIYIADGGGKKLSDNLNVMYYHFIGNDFAGVYQHFYTRWSRPDTIGGIATADGGAKQDKGTAVLSPVSPTEFTVQTAYYVAPNYDVTFTKTGSGATATYSNFAVKFLPADVAAGGTWATNITVTTQPKFEPADFATNPYDPTKQYTYTQALGLFRIYFQTASRTIIDTYVKQ
ncbi:MAG: DUF1735 domain-containing protein [Sphingobacteriales bacterium]